MNGATPHTETPTERRKRTAGGKPRPRRQPPYNVILLDDNDHTYDYVIRMLQQLFGYQLTRGFKLAQEVDESGRAILLTTTFEHAELKREQIHAFGRDDQLPRSAGSMNAILEPVS